jgi:hypothetical protein
VPLVHQELCFGCGRSNLFGLLAELEPAGDNAVRGRCFIKQDHQGARPGVAHEGVVAAALSEAMAFARGPDARPARLAVELSGEVPVGAWLELHAQATRTEATATATVDGVEVASARGSYE